MSRRPKGSGSIRERDGRYEASYSFTDPAGKRRRRSKLFTTRTAARRWLTAGIAEAESGQVADPGKLTLRGYLEDWLGSLGLTSLEPATVSWYGSAVRRHIIPLLGDQRLDKLSPVMIEAFLADRAERGTSRRPRRALSGECPAAPGHAAQGAQGCGPERSPRPEPS